MKLVGPRAILDAVAKSKGPFPTPAGNLTQVIHLIAQVITLTELLRLSLVEVLIYLLSSKGILNIMKNS